MQSVIAQAKSLAEVQQLLLSEKGLKTLGCQPQYLEFVQLTSPMIPKEKPPVAFQQPSDSMYQQHSIKRETSASRERSNSASSYNSDKHKPGHEKYAKKLAKKKH